MEAEGLTFGLNAIVSILFAAAGASAAITVTDYQLVIRE